ncbi:MAG: hypothetical protein Q9209_001645 [Squamulea sp. 1 TL-2023]
MYLMIDVVVNHYGWAGSGSTVEYRKMYPFTDRDYFHPYRKITSQDYLSNQTAVEQWVSSLVSVFGVDGLRIDTVKHVEKSFWPSFKSAAGVYALGEVFDGDVAYTCPYQEQLDGLLNYPLYYALTRAFRDTNGSMVSLGAALRTVQDSCRDPTLLGTFSENHDNPRFLSQRDDENAYTNVVVFTILAGGIPIIYQGQEQGFLGGKDPLNREALWTSGYSTKSPLYTVIASVNRIRNHEILASSEYLTTPTSVIYTDDHHIALRKGRLISVYSNEGSNAMASNFSLNNAGFRRNQPIVEILTCRNFTTDAQGNLQVSVLEGLPQIFQQQSDNDNMTIRSVASADVARTMKDEEAYPQLVDLENLVAVRKSITGSNLSMAHLDQIIAKTIDDIQKDDDPVHLKGNSALALKKLNGIRMEMMAFGGELSGVNTLIEQTIISSCGKMEIAIENTQALPEHDWSIPLANFTVGSSVFSNTTSKHRLTLTCTQQDPEKFSLFDGPLNLQIEDEKLGFNINAILGLDWVPTQKKVHLVYDLFAEPSLWDKKDKLRT